MASSPRGHELEQPLMSLGGVLVGLETRVTLKPGPIGHVGLDLRRYIL